MYLFMKQQLRHSRQTEANECHHHQSLIFKKRKTTDSSRLAKP